MKRLASAGRLRRLALFLVLPALMALSGNRPESPAPLRIAIVGLVHGHVNGFLRDAMQRSDIELVGVYDPDPRLLAERGARFDVPESMRYTDLATMLDVVRPEAITIFTNTFDHRRVVEMAAARGIHAMMEKPLAVSMEHAQAIRDAAYAAGIHVLVNYETTWYASNQFVYRRVIDEGAMGEVRKIVVHDGHEGPREIGVEREFFDWLTDPELNGGGALTDFGCYGANLMTWLRKGERPIAVTAVLQHLKTDDPGYARVDDEANILVEYPDATGIIQASWNWPFGRKDMEVYAETGYAIALDADRLRVRLPGEEEQLARGAGLKAPFNHPLSYLAAVVRGEIRVAPHDLSSLENNLTVTEILDAARVSAATGRRVLLTP
ncbi:MAG: Gfo/Idh/MocA family oxidoreductase [Rhodothermales bacterium]